MIATPCAAIDLTPPPFFEGLCDWSRGDGSPSSPTYEGGDAGRIARNDADFGACLELRKVEAVQRLRYMGELPLRHGAYVEVVARIKALRGPLPVVRIGASAGGAGGVGLPDLPQAGPERRLTAHQMVAELRAVIGREADCGADIVWDARALFAHIGIDLLGPMGGVVRIENLKARELPSARCALPGFEAIERSGGLPRPALPR